MLKIRLQRRGRKKRPFYAIVVAEHTAPRDGKFVEKLGTYDPLTNPATVDVNFERALYWLEVGAQPTDTARSLLRQKGVLYMKHLRRGLKKGAFDENELQRRFDEWKKAHEAKIAKLVASENAKKQKKIENAISVEKESRRKKEELIRQKLAKATEQQNTETETTETNQE